MRVFNPEHLSKSDYANLRYIYALHLYSEGYSRQEIARHPYYGMSAEGVTEFLTKARAKLGIKINARRASDNAFVKGKLKAMLEEVGITPEQLDAWLGVYPGYSAYIKQVQVFKDKVMEFQKRQVDDLEDEAIEIERAP